MSIETETENRLMHRVMLCGAVALGLGLSACGQGGEDQDAAMVAEEPGVAAVEMASADAGPSTYVVPAGVGIEDLTIEGRDLLVMLPNGEQIRVEGAVDNFDSFEIDGAVFPFLLPSPVPGTDGEQDLRRARVSEMADGWNPEPVYHYAFDAMDPSLSVSAGEAGTMFDPADDYWGLPRTDGYMLVDQNCTACHSIRIVMQQHQTEERWDYLLTWMVQDQGMWEMPAEERASVLAYLVEHFGPAGVAEE
jgi:hypothetical protein